MADIAQLESDRAAENGGRRTRLPHGLDAEFLIAGTASDLFRDAKWEVAREMRSEGIVAEEQGAEGEVRLAARIVLGWWNLTAGGAPYEYSAENALALMRRCPALVGDVIEYASLRSHYRAGEPYRIAADGDGLGN